MPFAWTHASIASVQARVAGSLGSVLVTAAASGKSGTSRRNASCGRNTNIPATAVSAGQSRRQPAQASA